MRNSMSIKLAARKTPALKESANKYRGLHEQKY